MVPGTTLIRNSQCQEKSAVIQPPSVGPMVGAAVATRPMSTELLARRFGENTVKDVAKTVGIMAPPNRPCRARNTIMVLRSPAKAQAALMQVKPMQVVRNSQRVEKARLSQPESGMV